MIRSLRTVIACAAVASAAACSGGGSGGGGAPPPPPPAPTLPPTGGTGPTTFNVISVPAGLAVSIVNGGATSSAVAPATVTAATANTAAKITIAPSNGAAPFVFVGDQRSNGAHTVLYNQSADTAGSLATVSASSVRRGAAAQSFAANLPRRRVAGWAARPSRSATRLVVRYRAALLRTSGARADDVERSVGIASAREVGFETAGLTTRVVDVPAGSAIADVAARLRARPEVASAEPERLYYTETSTPVAPNDPAFTIDTQQQWSLYRIGAPNAWGYTTGSPGVAIAIIDTGADAHHPDLAGSKITFEEKVVNGTTTAGAAAAQDTDGHGTNVAGIAAADTNNAYGIAGAGFNTSLQIYKVFADGTKANNYNSSANSGDVTQAIYDAVKHGAKVINLSLGTCQADGVDTMQRDAVAYAIGQGVTVVAASGNERSGGGSGTCAGASSTVDYPAAYDGAIAVGASKLDDSVTPAREGVAPYSNAGPGLALVAPGGDPSSTSDSDVQHWIYGLSTSTAVDPSFQCVTPPDCFALFAGTSQAAPHVAGVAALMLAANGNLTPGQIKTILTSTADDIGDPNQGAGRLDAYRALAAATGDAAPPALPAKPNFVAFAYVPNGTNVPQIVDVTYPAGVPVASDGTFRIADIPAGASGYKIGVWSDTNGDGKIDAGDSFGSTAALCSASAPCSGAAGIVTHPVPAGFVLN